MNWCLADDEVEVLDGTKGKVEGLVVMCSTAPSPRGLNVLCVSPHGPLPAGSASSRAVSLLFRSRLEVSRVSKLHMFVLFQNLTALRSRHDLLQYSSYSEVKAAAAQYQEAKGQFFKALREMGYGNWISKPQEEKSFNLAAN